MKDFDNEVYLIVDKMIDEDIGAIKVIQRVI